MKQQIEDMAKDICKLGKPCEKCSAYPDACKAVKYAERFYTAGYRKQSENVIELPFKVGQTVWVYNQCRCNVYKNTIVEIKIQGKSPYKNKITTEYRNTCGELSYRRFTWAQIGKQVFSTEQEAVSALTEHLRKEGE